MKKYIVFLLILASLNLMAQSKLSDAERQQIITKIDLAAKKMQSMQCDFTQTKRMKLLKRDMQSCGVMYFKRPDKLRWQYTSPYDYIFTMNGNQVQLKSTRSTQNINVQQNKMFRQITSIILSSITGSSLKSNADFTVELYRKDKSYFARLYPKKKEIKQIYQSIEIHFNPALTMVTTVHMLEKTGDETIVRLNNTKTNTTINENLFSTR